jgi:hypothetical protein
VRETDHISWEQELMSLSLVDHGQQKLRRSKADIDLLKSEIVNILEGDRPMTVRQVFYQLVVRGLIDKTEQEYKGVVVRLLTEMRMTGAIPFPWIVDESRRTRTTRTYDSIADAVADTAKFYRRSALRECDDYVEIWSEKEALSGVIFDVASDYDVPVVVSKGMPSITQVFTTFGHVYRAAEAGKRSHLYQFGDHDPTGCMIIEAMRSRLDEFAQRYDCPPPIIERIALTEEQVRKFGLPSRPTKRDGNTHAKDFAGDSTELDALPSAVLRDLVRNCIERHIPSESLATLRAAEESERETLRFWGKSLTDKAGM